MAQSLPAVLSSEEELSRALATGGCKVVEVCSEAFGPCRSIVPTLKRLRLEGKDEEALAFLQIAAEACKHHELAKEHHGQSEPLFLVYRNGAFKTKVRGANIPGLLAAIGEWYTPIPGLDDVQENPFYLSLNNKGSSSSGGGGKDSKRSDGKQAAGNKK